MLLDSKYSVSVRSLVYIFTVAKMRRLLFLLFFLPIFARAEWDQLFSDREDPSVFHHVNVITGNLNLSFQDVVARGAKSIPLTRTYSSAGALERTPQNSDLILQGVRRGWMVQGGWNMFPHTNLLIEPSDDRKLFKVYLAEPSGSLISYAYSHKKEGTKHTIFLKPTRSMSQASGHLGARTNPENNLLEMDLEAGEAVLWLPDGGSRTYRGNQLHHYNPNNFGIQKCYYLLSKEDLPSKHSLRYAYDPKTTDLKKIETTNSTGEKVYSSIDFDYSVEAKDHSFLLKASTSDKKELKLRSFHAEARDYINDVQSNCRPQEVIQYVPGRKGIGVRMRTLAIDGKEQLQVDYYLPPDKNHERKWVEKPEQKHFEADKVKSIQAPVGLDGKDITLAQFSYRPGVTEVRDVEGLLTRYHHDSDRLLLIEYFNEKNELKSSQKFYWNGSRLRCKAMLDAAGQPIFAKTFAYDNVGNVEEEVLWGLLTGEKSSPLAIDAEGNPSGAESYKKTYSYGNRFNVPEVEEEEDGPTYEYCYRPNTDLLEAKFTKDEHRILIREFYLYDEDNLLVDEIIDNGTSTKVDNFTDVTQRREKHYDLNPKTGLPEMVTESYWDPKARKHLLKKTKLAYLNSLVKEEEVYDAESAYRYTIFTDYDDFGRVERKTTPLGQENTYLFDKLGHLKEAKEVGSPKKTYSYDATGFQASVETDTGQITTTEYDTKGRLLSETDAKDNRTTHSYDHFGNRQKTTFPKTKDEQGLVYEPIAKFGYDIHGNLTSAEMPLGETTQTFYNILRKPIRIIQADGTELRHFYNKNGTLAKTIYPDGTEVHCKYDLFQRMTSKTIHSKAGKVLDSETWDYSSFQLTSHTDSRGLKILFTYDGAGRKTCEEAEDRKTTFTYDALGFLGKTDNRTVAQIQKHGVGGLITEQWEEDSQGRIENHMLFFYDKENRKEKAIRTTSQGKATDLFGYEKGRLTNHIDPIQAETKIIYDETVKNDLDQFVLQKTIIDPLGNATIDTHDAGDRLIQREKKSPQGQTVSREAIFYDQSGNKSKRVSFVYLDGKLIKEIPVSWKYDRMSRVKEETEAGRKTTFYDYDSRGCLEWHTLPSGIKLHYSYDGMGRLEELSSSDKTVHYQYVYKQGPEPAQILDLVQKTTLERTYNHFGQLTQETSLKGLSQTWEYDGTGRCSVFTLPDHSSIGYTYSGSHMASVERLAPDETALYQHQYCQFDPNGHVAQEELIHGLGTVKPSHDLLERPSSQDSAWFQQSIAYGSSGLVKGTQNSFYGEKNYDYDALNQLSEEGDQKYRFDSLGNSADFETNDLNQVMTTPDCTFTYNSDGNPKERILADQSIGYAYDALARLVEITYPHQKKVRYIYDPLSRLFSKKVSLYSQGSWQPETTTYYLYDQEQEIGTLDEKGALLQLRVLGLGIKGDIGAAIAIETQGQTYAPLHDFNGNVIALLSPDGQVAESYHMDAFGKEKLSTPNPLNPWRFCSKRSEEGLIFFGLRFYDPSLGRWLTPDPAGFADGANLYAYVFNSPMNRLDLFGLFGEDQFVDLRIELNIVNIPLIPGFHGLIGKGSINGILTDFYLTCGHWHKLQFTPEELHVGKIDIMNHLPELLPNKGHTFGLLTHVNGIHTSFDTFVQNCTFCYSKIPEGTLSINMHNPTEGKWEDAVRTIDERNGIQTAFVMTNQEFMGEVLERLHKINDQILWGYIPHSEGGVITVNSIEGLTPWQQELAQKHLSVFAIGPALPVRNDYASQVMNIYSESDHVTKSFGMAFLDSPYFNIRILQCTSKWSERTGFFADHAFKGGTYGKAMDGHFRDWRTENGFYNGNTR